ncbi:MAG: pyridoxal 5'-phosphate synthase glutaminase subunit PdxT [Thaumarchaeota archaeon]|nr:pyridoxal 5'-phosphate synthase glutaminase subunit PdxT [Nitrososphaerota archaeon]
MTHPVSPLIIGVLGFQGDIEEHLLSTESAFKKASIKGHTLRVRERADLSKIHALIIPGGESTVIGGMLLGRSMVKELSDRLMDGLPTMGTCAGLIFLAKRVYDRVVGDMNQPSLGVLDVLVERNAFGRQRQSFQAEFDIPRYGLSGFNGTFIRSPVIKEVGPHVDVLAKLGDDVIAVQQGNILATAFHPELSMSSIFHEELIKMASSLNQ